MAGTKPDILTKSRTWISANAASGIAVGSAMRLQNKTNKDLTVFEGPTPPADTSPDGDLYGHRERITIGAGSAEIWLWADVPSGRVGVQEV